ncbi:MAG: hypothetical protein Q4E54_03880 [Lachnospiraceae bacterium]|nr:hypothetical protein [Lachnospiraceae bacterium]
MNLKKIGIILFAAALSLSATGCVEREIVQENKVENIPDVTIKTDIEINWDQVMDDCEALLDPEEYPYGCYLDFAVHDDTNTTEIIWPLKSDCPVKEMPKYGEAFAKAFNDAISIQDFSVAQSSDDSYGGYWENHDMDVQVYYEKDIMEPKKYWVNQIIPAGSNDPIILNPNLEE